jgi:hypothetical protein
LNIFCPRYRALSLVLYALGRAGYIIHALDRIALSRAMFHPRARAGELYEGVRMEVNLVNAQDGSGPAFGCLLCA